MSSFPRARLVLALLVAAAIWLPSVRLFYRVDGAERAAIVRALTERQIAAWSRPAVERADLRQMRGVNPEWDFMSRTYTVLALADQALDAPPDERERRLRTIDAIVDDTLATESAAGQLHFLLPYAKRGPFRDPDARSVFVDGEVLMMIAARDVVAHREATSIEARARAARIEAAMRRGPSLSAESYPDECWTFCNTTALAALATLDAAHGTSHDDLARAWVAHAREHLVDARTGILVSSYTYTGRTLDGPEGSSIWMSAQNLLFLDEDFARDQYARARRELGASFLGFAWAREWPRGVPARPDVDSGPIVPLLDASAGSSGLAILGASAFADAEYERGLLASLELAAFPERDAGGRRYRASNAVGDAVLLRALSFGGLAKRVAARSRRTAEAK